MAQKWYVSWQQFHEDCEHLAEKLKGAGPFTGIVAVARGGLAPALLLSQLLDIRLIDTCCLASYTDDHAQDELKLLKACPQGEGLYLVVDDLVDSGKTAALVRAQRPDARIVVLYAKPQGAPYVDAFVKEVPQDCWIVFPWEEPSHVVKTWPL